MILNCTYCGNEFEQPSRTGRPMGFCSDDCKANARKDPRRICRTCGGTFLKTESEYPFHCSEECRSSNDTKCLQCGKTSEDRFCSGECLAAHYPNRTCNTCNGPVVKSDPPFNIMPRYCSDECREDRMEERGINSSRRARQYAASVKLRERMELTQLTKQLPVRGRFTPYNIRAKHAPPLDGMPPNILHSIDWWNTVLPEMPTPAIIETGWKGWGLSQPAACLPLVQCWPWITDEVRKSFQHQEVLQVWAVMQSNYPSESTINTEKDKVMRLVDASRQHGRLSAANIDRLKKFMKMTQPPNANLYMPPDDQNLYWDWQFTQYPVLNDRRLSSYEWQPIVLRDRLTEEIDRILERHK